MAAVAAPGATAAVDPPPENRKGNDVDACLDPWINASCVVGKEVGRLNCGVGVLSKCRPPAG